MGINILKQKIKNALPSSLVAFLYAAKLSLKKLPEHHVYEEYLEHKSGIEIGGPSVIFRTVLPVYRVVSHLDGVNFSSTTMWEGSLKEGTSFRYDRGRAGIQYIAEATDLSMIPSDTYDFLLSSNCLEHIANPFAALEEWKRVVVPNGYMVVVLPKKSSNFDHRRPVTSFQHLLDDYAHHVDEHDLTHLDEILSLHDLSRDPQAEGFEQFRARCMDNFSHRGMHHHVFDTGLIERMFAHLDIHIMRTDETDSDYYALGQVVK